MAEKATTELTTGASTPRSGDSSIIIPEALDSEALEEVAASAEKGIYVTKEEGDRVRIEAGMVCIEKIGRAASRTMLAQSNRSWFWSFLCCGSTYDVTNVEVVSVSRSFVRMIPLSKVSAFTAEMTLVPKFERPFFNPFAGGLYFVMVDLKAILSPPPSSPAASSSGWRSGTCSSTGVSR